MKLAIIAELEYALPAATDVLLQLEAAVIPEQQVEQAHINLPPTEHFARLPGHDSVGDRVWLRTSGNLCVRYEGRVDVERLSADVSAMPSIAPHLLPAETIQYMLPSRFCPSDKFQDLVAAEFGGTFGGGRVAAIADWVGSHLSYVQGSSTDQTTALETYVTRKGVCRDFAHLVIAMVRASAIPARFASVYGLGVDPQDFHAVPEVFLDNTWFMLDPTGMSNADSMAKIGIGRDAADVSFLTSYGPATLVRQAVSVSPA